MDRRSIARNGAIQTLTPRGSEGPPPRRSEGRPRGIGRPTPGDRKADPERPAARSIVICRGISHHPALSRLLRTPAEMPEITTKTPAKNVLWIMCDQLRYDYLGCTGHPVLKTPNIDAMAKRG